MSALRVDVFASPPAEDRTVALLARDDQAEGNVYLYVDGVEYGSLFLHDDGDGVDITLGQYDPDEQQWVDRNDLRPVRYE